MALTPGTKLGPYKIESPLGAGGMGEVYRARDTRLDRTVAVKVLSEHLSSNPDAKLRFEREARAISSLNHPNICTLHDIGHQDGTDFLVMEFLDGETLADRLAKGPLPPQQVLSYGIEICEGLEKAHKSGVIHRDLKPGNIMLTKSGVKLMDFGLAKAMSSHEQPSGLTVTVAVPPGGQPLTTQGTLLGTLQYMSPEQLEGKEADARSDIFALGAVLYEMATGRPAFTGQSQASIVAAVLVSEPPSISMAQPTASPALDRVVKACMAKDPDERWQTVHNVKQELRWIAQGDSQAGVATPVPVVVKRRGVEKLAWTLAGIAALAAAVAIVYVVGPILRAPAHNAVPVTPTTPSTPTSSATTSSATTASSPTSAVPDASPSTPAVPLASAIDPPLPVRPAPTPDKSSSDAAPDAAPAPKASTARVAKAPAEKTPAPPPAPQPEIPPPSPPPPDPAQLLQDGKTQLADQNAEAARESFRKSADGGNAAAAVLLGTLYAQGIGGPKNDPDAFRMFKKAADAGNARGMFNLGLMYEAGRVVTGTDNRTAAHWYSEAEKRGDRDAANRLGMMYEEGRGVTKDVHEAARLYTKAGTPDAKARLAKLPPE
jgi:serine/threonine protein kinase